MIGIIFNHKKLNKISNQEEVHENIPFYYQLAEKNKVDLFFYSMRNLFYRTKKIKGLLYSHKSKKLIQTSVEIPKVNILRTTIKSRRIFNKLKRLEKIYNIAFINMISERNKYKLYQYLSSFKNIARHIPDTALLTNQTFAHFIEKYGTVVIKPINGARGEKIYKFSKEGNYYIMHYTRGQIKREKTMNVKQLASFLGKLSKYPSSFLVQRWISFKEYEGNKFDIRISVQKDKVGEWKITGMVARVAADHGIVTNIAQGGRAVSFKKIVPLLDPEIIRNMKRLSVEIAEAIEKNYSGTADLGLDIALDQNDQLWFIEANYCDERYSYCESDDLDMWRASYTTPFEYAYAVYSKY